MNNWTLFFHIFFLSRVWEWNEWSEWCKKKKLKKLCNSWHGNYLNNYLSAFFGHLWGKTTYFPRLLGYALSVMASIVLDEVFVISFYTKIRKYNFYLVVCVLFVCWILITWIHAEQWHCILHKKLCLFFCRFCFTFLIKILSQVLATCPRVSYVFE